MRSIRRLCMQLRGERVKQASPARADWTGKCYPSPRQPPTSRSIMEAKLRPGPQRRADFAALKALYRWQVRYAGLLCFDCFADGEDLRPLPLTARKKRWKPGEAAAASCALSAFRRSRRGGCNRPVDEPGRHAQEGGAPYTPDAATGNKPNAAPTWVRSRLVHHAGKFAPCWWGSIAAII